LRQDFPASAAVFGGMGAEDAGHRRRLIDLFRATFGEHIPLIRRQDVKSFVQRKPGLRKSARTKTAPRIWMRKSCVLRSEKMRNARAGDYSCSRSCSRVLPV
jgi:hypothetical protein